MQTARNAGASIDSCHVACAALWLLTRASYYSYHGYPFFGCQCDSGSAVFRDPCCDRLSKVLMLQIPQGYAGSTCNQWSVLAPCYCVWSHFLIRLVSCLFAAPRCVWLSFALLCFSLSELIRFAQSYYGYPNCVFCNAATTVKQSHVHQNPHLNHAASCCFHSATAADSATPTAAATAMLSTVVQTAVFAVRTADWSPCALPRELTAHLSSLSYRRQLLGLVVRVLPGTKACLILCAASAPMPRSSLLRPQRPAAATEIASRLECAPASTQSTVWATLVRTHFVSWSGF
jgi:hypothetical protein